MNDPMKFAILSARLDSVRKHIPSYIEEQEVLEYHAIIPDSKRPREKCSAIFASRLKG
jgi:hypothetical protein